MKNIISLIIAFLSVGSSVAQVLVPGNYIITLADGGKALDADGPGMNTNGGMVHLWDNNAGSTQVWSIKQVGGNTYSIVLLATGKALDADGPGMYTDGGIVHLWDKRNDGFKTQSWKINPSGNNSYTVVLADGGKALDAGISSMHANNGLVHLWSSNNGNTQKWTFTPAIPLSNGQTVITSLYSLSNQDNAFWENANSDQLGIIGNDFRGPERIGTASFERDFKANAWYAKITDALTAGQLDNLNFWVPQHREQVTYKRTLVGKLSNSVAGEEPNPHIADIDEVYPDFDLNVDLIPDPKYKYLLTDIKAREYTKLMWSQYEFSAHQSGLKDCDAEGNVLDFTERIETEVCIDPKKLTHSNDAMITNLSQTPNQQICVYGPWIYDKGHCCHPEIHPTEEIWWRADEGTGKRYYCNVFCDASERFWWRDQMDDGTKLKPWGAPPVAGLFAIAFEIPITNGGSAFNQSIKNFEVSYIDHYNITEYPGANMTYSLIYQNRTLVTFTPHNGAFKVSFEKVGFKPGNTNIIRGFLVLQTSVGTCTQVTNKIMVTAANGLSVPLDIPPGTSPQQVDQKYERQIYKKEKGHYMFSVLETNTRIRPVPPARTDTANFIKPQIIHSR
jgi:hypothetical protein